MDLEEWEFLSPDAFIDQIHLKDKRVIPRENQSLHTNSPIDSEYFQKFDDPQEGSVSQNLVIPVPMEFDISIPEPIDESAVKEVISPETLKTPFQVFGSEPVQETGSSQVFFKKLKGNEFADMKLDSPKSANRGLLPKIDLGMPQLGDRDEDTEDSGESKNIPSKGVETDEKYTDPDQKRWEIDQSHGGLNIWKMGMTGIGAVCSFGFACAAIFVIATGDRHRGNNHFQVCTDDKRRKLVVQHATKVNDAISAVRAPLSRSRAHINIGGYLDGLS